MLKEFLVTLGQEDISGKFSETSVHYFSQSYLYNIRIRTIKPRKTFN